MVQSTYDMSSIIHLQNVVICLHKRSRMYKYQGDVDTYHCINDSTSYQGFSTTFWMNAMSSCCLHDIRHLSHDFQHFIVIGLGFLLKQLKLFNINYLVELIYFHYFHIVEYNLYQQSFIAIMPQSISKLSYHSQLN